MLILINISCFVRSLNASGKYDSSQALKNLLSQEHILEIIFSAVLSEISQSLCCTRKGYSMKKEKLYTTMRILKRCHLKFSAPYSFSLLLNY